MQNCEVLKILQKIYSLLLFRKTNGMCFRNVFYLIFFVTLTEWKNITFLILIHRTFNFII